MAGLELRFYDLKAGQSSCSFTLGVAGHRIDDGMAGLGILRRNGTHPTAWGYVYFEWLLPVVGTGGTGLGDVYHAVANATGNGINSYAQTWQFSHEAFEHWLAKGLLPPNATFSAAGVGVSPWVDARNPRLGEYSMMLNVECRTPTRVGVRIAKEAILATHLDFPSTLHAEGGDLALTLAGMVGLNFASSQVEVLAGGEGAEVSDPVQMGSLKISMPGESARWDFRTPYPFELYGGAGLYELTLDRVGRGLFFVAALGWNSVSPEAWIAPRPVVLQA